MEKIDYLILANNVKLRIVLTAYRTIKAVIYVNNLIIYNK